MPPSPGPLGGLTDTELRNASLALQLACGRNHSTSNRKRNQYFCFLNRVLKLEADLRGITLPGPPLHVGDLPVPHGFSV